MLESDTDANFNDDAKKFQASSPVKANSGYGTPTSMRATRVNTTEKMIVLTTAVALLLAMCNLFFRDVKYLTDIVLSVAMFSTTALYPASLVGGRAGWLIAHNPLSLIIDAYRDALLFHRMPMTPTFAALTLGCVSLLAVSWLLFHRAEYRFAESV